MTIYTHLQQALIELIEREQIHDESIQVSCAALTPEQAIGQPLENDYPIQKSGREHMVEAVFRDSFGQSFSRQGGHSAYRLSDLCTMPLDDDRHRADFIAALNAVYACYGRCNRTVHCHDQEPAACAEKLLDLVPKNIRVALFGLQPRFLQALVSRGPVRAVDLDPDHIGETKFGVLIEGPEKTAEVLEWCDYALITGSSIVNDTLRYFVDLKKPHCFFGTTIAASAVILDLPRFCALGHDVHHYKNRSGNG